MKTTEEDQGVEGVDHGIQAVQGQKGRQEDNSENVALLEDEDKEFWQRG